MATHSVVVFHELVDLEVDLEVVSEVLAFFEEDFNEEGSFWAEDVDVIIEQMREGFGISLSPVVVWEIVDAFLFRVGRYSIRNVDNRRPEQDSEGAEGSSESGT